MLAVYSKEHLQQQGHPPGATGPKDWSTIVLRGVALMISHEMLLKWFQV